MIIGTVCAFAIRGMASDGAYAIRPYPDGRKTRRVCGMSPPDTPKTKQPDTFTHAGLHSHSDGRAVHSQK